MPYEFRPQARKLLRLQSYNYSRPGYYFITLCTEGRLCLFGDIVNGMMLLNKAGCMIHAILKDVSNYFVSAKMDTFIVMPNHIHCIVGLYDTGPAQRPAPTHSFPEIIAIIKSYTTHLYSQGVRELGYLAFSKRLWQRNYYEHIIRNENSLKKLDNTFLTTRCNGKEKKIIR